MAMSAYVKFMAGMLLVSATALQAAQGAPAVPEPADFALFAAGIGGLLIGRMAAQKRRKRRDDEDA